MNLPGIDNFERVSPTLYRGARPDANGIEALAGLGVYMVVDLERWWLDWFNLGEGHAVNRAGMAYRSIPCSPWHPKQADVDQFIDYVQDPFVTPIFVHCREGKDRTGMMCAIYRIAVMGWTKQAAIAEMYAFGYHADLYPEIVRFVEGWK